MWKKSVREQVNRICLDKNCMLTATFSYTTTFYKSWHTATSYKKLLVSCTLFKKWERLRFWDKELLTKERFSSLSDKCENVVTRKAPPSQPSLLQSHEPFDGSITIKIRFWTCAISDNKQFSLSLVCVKFLHSLLWLWVGVHVF